MLGLCKVKQPGTLAHALWVQREGKNEKGGLWNWYTTNYAVAYLQGIRRLVSGRHVNETE